jgi:hypothetical protein
MPGRGPASGAVGFASGPLVRWRQQGVAVTSTGKAAEADVASIDAGTTLRQAGHLMRELGVGALGVRGEDGEVRGTISRDMVVRRIAAGGDPKSVTVGEVAGVAAPARTPRLAAREDDGPAADAGGYEMAWAQTSTGPAWQWTGQGTTDGMGPETPPAAA